MRRTITWLLYILMGVQILFGCAYFVANFSAGQQFAENYVPALPTAVSSLAQIFAAAASTWYFLGKLGFLENRENRLLRGYICAFLLTVPCLLQMHAAKLVWSLSLSCLLWMLGLLLEAARRGVTKKRACLLLGAYFLYGIICPDGLWTGGILLLAGFFLGKIRGGKLRLAVLLTACLIFFANLGLNGVFQEERRIYRENNLGTAAVSRFVWPNFASNYFFWDEDVKAVLSEEDAVQLCQRIDLLEKEFYPAMVEAYGTGKATKLCLKMGYRCLMDRSKETVLEIGRDFRDHLLIPFTIENNLQGRGVSLTAWNYGRMKAHTPILAKYYYRYGTFELPFLLLGSLLLWWFYRSAGLGQWMKQRAAGEAMKSGGSRYEDGEGAPAEWKLLCFTAVLYTAWYTMRGNLPIDYKLVLPVLFIWYLASIGGLLCQKAEN